MKSSLSVLLLFAAWAALAAQPKLDLNFQQSPPKPQPDWVKIVDHGQFDARLKGYYAPEGLKIEIVAEAPTIVNPVGMTFDTQGNLYVLEWTPPPEALAPGAKNVNFPESSVEFTYKDGTKRKVAIMKKPVKDVVKRLRDTKDAGVYDEAKVVLHDELPSSILVHDGWLYTSGQGTVRRHKLDTLGTDSVVREVIAQGFCGFHHHQVSGLTIGNDGWLYITSGDDDNFVEGSDGSRADVLRTGAVFRCRPDGSRLHTYALGFRNPYRDVAFDAAFNMFHVDNDNEDGSKFTGCRLMHIAEGNDFGWRLRLGARCCVPDHVRGAVYGELPGKVAPLLKTGRGAPAGLLIYNDVYFPRPYRGLLYYPDVFRRTIRAYQVEPKGATFEATAEFEFLRSDDPLFRPCQMVLGPDGAMYVCDWRTDSGGAGKLWGDGKNGRIYRLSWKGDDAFPAIPTRSKESWARLVQQGERDLFKELDGDNFSDRQKAQQELVRRGAKLLPSWLDVLKNGSTPARIAALGAVQSFWNDDVQKAIIELLAAAPDELRRLGVEAIGLNAPRGNQEACDILLAGLSDQSPAVLRAVVVALGKVGGEGAAEALVNALRFDKGKDEYLRDGIVRGLEHSGKDAFLHLLALADSGEAKDLERLLEVYPAFRTREAVPGILTLLNNYHVTPEQKVELIRSYNNYQFEPPIDVTPLAEYLAKLPEEKAEMTKKERAEVAALVPVKLAALEVLAGHGKLTSERIRDTLVSLLKAEEAAVRRSVIKAIGAARMTKAVPILLEQLDKATDEGERIALVETLGDLREKDKVLTALDKILQAPDASNDLRLAALRALIQLDARRMRAQAKPFLSSSDGRIVEEAAALLAGAPEGAKHLAAEFLANRLPRTTLPQVAESLRHFASDDKECARLLAEVMKGGLLVALTPHDVARIGAELKTKAKSARGRALYLNNKALACMSCHRLEGIGGNVGPDLTRIWETHSLEKVMEAMLDPSKEIKEGYQSYSAVTKDGKVHLGLKIAHTVDELTLKDALGKEIKIPAANLDELIPAKKSLMPDDVVRHLGYTEFLDLVAFLRDRAMQESLRGLALDFEVRASENQLKPWQADASGYVDLRRAVGPDSPAASARTHVFAPKRQSVKFVVGASQLMTVRINDKLVYKNSPQLAADADEFEAALEMGWNEIVINVGSEEPTLGFYLRVVGDGLRINARKE
jgi:putative membrane-bound dehydrogenase-like protein